jgi:hypothetical protein
MAWYSKLFSSVAVDLASTVGGVIDELVTSDEEMALTKNQKLKIQTAYNVKMQELLNDLDKRQMEHEQNLESELTNRLKIDMKSDSVLSKNIRPLALIFLTLTVSVLALVSVIGYELEENQIAALKIWTPFFTTIMVTVYAFYFGSRGLEKMQKMKSSGATDVEKVKRQLIDINQEPKG